MMPFRFSKNLFLPLLLLLFILPFGYDIYRFYSDMDIQTLNYVSETLTILFGLLYFVYLQKSFSFTDKSIQDNLRLFVYLLGVLYLAVILAQLMFTPSYSIADFPFLPETISSVIYSNLISNIAILTMVPILIVMKGLIYHKRTRRSYFFMRSLVIASAATIISAVITRSRFSLEFDVNDAGIYNDVFLSIVIALIFLQAFRNSWITYLSRKEKVTYFFISLFLFWAVYYLYDFSFKFSVLSHSFAAGVFVNITWYFLVVYVLFCSIYLLLHLPTARVFDRKMQELASLHDLSRVISSEFDSQKLVRLLTEMANKVINADAMWLELYRQNSEELYIASSQNLTLKETTDFGISGRLSLSEEILQSRKSILLNEISKNHPYAYLQEWKADIASIIGAPLISGSGKPLGFLFAARKYRFGFYPDDLAMLEAYANQAVIAFDNASLLKESFEHERMEEELRIAREVQQRLLPDKTPQFNGVAIEAMTITAYEVGGDYYDFINYSDNKLGLIIGDVSGKGTSAAFYMAEAKGIIQSLSKTFDQPRELL
ncbi:MAG: GAF domain-containing protein, partial [Calditrichales bacterium]